MIQANNFKRFYSLILSFVMFVGIGFSLGCGFKQQMAGQINANDKNPAESAIKDDNLSITALPDVPDYTSDGKISFGKDGLSAIAGDGFLLASRDGGVNWKGISERKADILDLQVAGISYKRGRGLGGSTDPSLELIKMNQLCPVEDSLFDESGRLYIISMCEHTTHIWSLSPMEPSSPFHIRVFPHNENGYLELGNRLGVVGDRVFVNGYLKDQAILLATDDGGDKWQQFWKSKNAARIVDFAFLNSQDGYMLLGNGKFLRTNDAGKHWNSFSMLPSNLSGNVASFAFVDSMEGFVVGDGGRIAKTSDGGKNWQLQNSGVKDFLHDVAAASGTKAWAIGGNRTVLKTDDGGANWLKIELGIQDTNEQYFDDIYNVTVNEGMAWIVFGRRIYTLK